MQKRFEPFGEVEMATIMVFPDSGRSRGFGFVTFKTSAGASAAVAASGSSGELEIAGAQCSVKHATRR